MNAHGIRPRGAVVVLALLTLGAAACGSSSAKSTSTQPQTSTTAAGSDTGGTPTTDSGGGTTTTAAAATKTGHLGDTLTNPDQYVPADVATVTLVKVIDPVPSSASEFPTPGSRWVGLEMTIVDNGANASVAVDQARITGSDGKDYASGAAIEGHVPGCTPTMTDLQPNQKATFCPGFMLPNGVTITKVGYSTRATDASQPSEITWAVP